MKRYIMPLFVTASIALLCNCAPTSNPSTPNAASNKWVCFYDDDKDEQHRYETQELTCSAATIAAAFNVETTAICDASKSAENCCVGTQNTCLCSKDGGYAARCIKP